MKADLLEVDDILEIINHNIIRMLHSIQYILTTVYILPIFRRHFMKMPAKTPKSKFEWQKTRQQFFELLSPSVDESSDTCVNGQWREAARGGSAQSGGAGNSGPGRGAARLQQQSF